MKKIVLLLMAINMVALNTKATETDLEKLNQFVKWTGTIPDLTQTNAVLWVKNAMRGGSIQNAEVRCDANNWIEVLEQNFYNEILAAPADLIVIGEANGTEKNFGVDPVTKKSKFYGYLAKGTKIIGLKRADGTVTPFAKWGTNGCLNAITPGDMMTYDEPDPDINQNRQIQQKQVQNYPQNFPTYNCNTQSCNHNHGNSEEISYREGKKIERVGVDEFKEHLDYGLTYQNKVLDQNGKVLQQNLSFCGSGSGVRSSGGGNDNAFVNTSNVQFQQKPRFIETWIGQTSSNAVGTALGIGIVRIAERIFGGRGCGHNVRNGCGNCQNQVSNWSQQRCPHGGIFGNCNYCYNNNYNWNNNGNFFQGPWPTNGGGNTWGGNTGGGQFTNTWPGMNNSNIGNFQQISGVRDPGAGGSGFQ